MATNRVEPFINHGDLKITPGDIIRRWIVLGIFVSLGTILATLHIRNFSVADMRFLGLLAMVIGLWAFDVVPGGIGGLILMMGAAVLQIAPASIDFAGFTSPILWLIIGGLILGAAANESGLGRRLALHLLARVRGDRPLRLLLVLFVAGAIVTQLIPVVYARVAIFLPVGLAIAQACRAAPGSRYGKFLMAAVFFASSGPYLATMTGFEPTLTAVAALQRAGHPIFWDQYLIEWIIPGLLMTSVLYFGIAVLLFRPSKAELPTWDSVVWKQELRDLGGFSRKEKRLLVVFFGVTLLWLTGSLTHLSPTVVAIAGAVVIFLPGMTILKPPDVARHVNILMVMLFAAALSIGPLLTHLKLTEAFGHALAHGLPVNHLGLGSAFLLSAIVQAVHIPVGTVTAAMATVSPILERYAVLRHVSPVVTTWIVVGSAQAYVFPYQNPTLLMVYNEGYWTMTDMIKIGLLVSVGALLLVPLSTVTWWAWTIH